MCDVQDRVGDERFRIQSRDVIGGLHAGFGDEAFAVF